MISCSMSTMEEDHPSSRSPNIYGLSSTATASGLSRILGTEKHGGSITSGKITGAVPTES